MISIKSKNICMSHMLLRRINTDIVFLSDYSRSTLNIHLIQSVFDTFNMYKVLLPDPQMLTMRSHTGYWAFQTRSFSLLNSTSYTSTPFHPCMIQLQNKVRYGGDYMRMKLKMWTILIKLHSYFGGIKKVNGAFLKFSEFLIISIFFHISDILSHDSIQVNRKACGY